MRPRCGLSALGPALIVLGAGCSTVTPPSPSLTTPSATGPVSTSRPTATASTSQSAPPVAREGWQPVPPQASIAGLRDVAWTGALFVAVGTSGEGRGIFAESTDGRTWRTQPAGDESASPSMLASGPSGLVAVGTIDGRPASWSSADGRAWASRARAFPTSLGDGDIVQVTDVAASGTGWLAVGRDLPGSGVLIDLRPIEALAWTSTDGLRWTLQESQPSLAEAGFNAIATLDGAFVAAGSRAHRAAIWSSTDGRTWIEAPDDPSLRPPTGAPGASVTTDGIAMARGTTVVVGTAYGVGDGGAPAARAWRSEGEGKWLEALVELSEVGQMVDVAATASRFVAVGPSWPDMSSCLGGIWASTDGAVWRCEATDSTFAGFRALAAAGSPTVELAVGMTDDGVGNPPTSAYAAWWRPAP